MFGISAKMEIKPMKVQLDHTRNRIRNYEHVVTNDAAKRLQKYIQESVKHEEHFRTGTLRSINRGGIHKRKLAKGSYEVYMKADYAIYVEKGTSRGLVGSHFFEKAVTRFDKAYLDIARDIFNDFV